MRGSDSCNESLFSTVRLEDFVPASHPLRPIRTWMNAALARMNERFSAMYEPVWTVRRIGGSAIFHRTAVKQHRSAISSRLATR